VASSSAPFRRSGWSHSAENVITRSAPFQLVKGERQSFYINGNLLTKAFHGLAMCYKLVVVPTRFHPWSGSVPDGFGAASIKRDKLAPPPGFTAAPLPYMQEQGIAGKAATVSCTHFPRNFSAASSYVQGFVNLSARLIHIDLYLELYHLPGSLE